MALLKFKKSSFILILSSILTTTVAYAETSLNQNHVPNTQVNTTLDLQSESVKKSLCSLMYVSQTNLQNLKLLPKTIDSADLQASLEKSIELINVLFEQNHLSLFEYCRIKPAGIIRDPRHISPATEYPRR